MVQTKFRLLLTEALVFFFQAEDGIRDYKVTGVQTCALPISARAADVLRGSASSARPARTWSSLARFAGSEMISARMGRYSVVRPHVSMHTRSLAVATRVSR